MKGYSFRVPTPDGTMFVHVYSNDAGMPTLVLINIGKAGTAVYAWGEAVARLITRVIPIIGINGVIEEVSGITADKIRATMDGTIVRSGPEGIAVALLRYRKLWYEDNAPKPKEGSAKINGH